MIQFVLPVKLNTAVTYHKGNFYSWASLLEKYLIAFIMRYYCWNFIFSNQIICWRNNYLLIIESDTFGSIRSMPRVNSLISCKTLVPLRSNLEPLFKQLISLNIFKTLKFSLCQWQFMKKICILTSIDLNIDRWWMNLANIPFLYLAVK